MNDETKIARIMARVKLLKMKTEPVKKNKNGVVQDVRE